MSSHFLKLSLLLLVCFTSCKQANDSNLSNQPEMATKKSLFGLLGNGKQTHAFRDARTGIVVNSTEYPKSWQVISKPIYTIDQKLPVFLTEIQGPNNLKSFNTPIKLFLHYPNYHTEQMMRQYGRNSNMIRRIVSSEQIMHSEADSRMINIGFQLVGKKRIPRAEQFIRNMLNKSGMYQTQFEHYATEWTNNKGQKALVSLVKIAMQQPLLNNDSMVMWFYSLDYMFVDESEFEDTINQLLEAGENTKDNPQWQQYTAQLNAARMQKAQQDHQIHMRNRQAAFNAHQQKMKGIWAAQDANYASFMNRTFGSGSNTAQKQFVNMINEQEIVYNPNTGKNYEVNAGSTEYWMDSDGNYIRNNDLFYNPNGDINLNNREWTKVKPVY
ncbi:hypothetical protein PW52_00135 [Tamlana sedimentorum]|uniref:Lipoprotein n=1 Tax=Neotamlana sedimentorum TaxID=1435349 RepID=A0A0D7WDY1_9FLAO|nr:hypothetical protein [Tamlana sedimentorum]KJD36908.1 hypothetical protein PW52_00135 [Tamlana sedimentorum]